VGAVQKRHRRRAPTHAHLPDEHLGARPTHAPVQRRAPLAYFKTKKCLKHATDPERRFTPPTIQSELAEWSSTRGSSHARPLASRSPERPAPSPPTQPPARRTSTSEARNLGSTTTPTRSQMSSQTVLAQSQTPTCEPPTVSSTSLVRPRTVAPPMLTWAPTTVLVPSLSRTRPP